MYYVIKKQHTSPLITFMSFLVPKYIASKSNENVIFEFQKDGKPIRKWVKKEDVILLTDDKAYFNKVLKSLKDTEAQQQKLVDEAKEHLNKSLETFTETMTTEIEKYAEIRDSSDVPDILKDL